MSHTKTGFPGWQRTVTSLLAAQLLAVGTAFTQIQNDATPQLLITPSSKVLVLGETSPIWAIDESGKPTANVVWSINPPIADLQIQDGKAVLQAREAGTALLTATARGQSVTATVSVLDAAKLSSGTVRWSLQPMPGFETLLVVQAVPNGSGPAFYSIEWSQSENAIVRALNLDGEQMWMTHISSHATPQTLHHRLPRAGQVFQNDVVVNDDALFIIGDKSGFLETHAKDPSALGLPADGKSILLGATGDASGGMLLLERGRFRDSLVDLNPTDGTERWRYRSPGRLANDWTANWNMDIGIVETVKNPASAALLIVSAETGQVRFHIPFPTSSSTIDGFRCQDPKRNILKSLRPPLFGSVFTSSEGTIYVQIETQVESLLVENCKNKQFSFDDSLSLLSVTPEGEANWTVFQHIHAAGDGNFVVQPRAFAGETIPDGSGGVLAAWTYFSPDTRDGHIHSQARVTRLDPSGQRDFELPMPYWTKGLDEFFDSNMVLGDGGNVLYATNGELLVRLDTEAAEASWVRKPPNGRIKLQFTTDGGGVLISNAGVFAYFDPEGKGSRVSWTVPVSNTNDIGLRQTDPFENISREPLQLRSADICWGGNFIAVEDGGTYGRGSLLYLIAQ